MGRRKKGFLKKNSFFGKVLSTTVLYRLPLVFGFFFITVPGFVYFAPAIMASSDKNTSRSSFSYFFLLICQNQFCRNEVVL